MKKILLIIVFTIALSTTYSQSKQDIVDYLKSRIELYSERPTTIEFSSCKLNFYSTMNIIGSPTYTTEMNCILKDLTDVMFVTERQVWITLKFRNKNVSYTDIEQNGTRKLCKQDDTINLFFSKGTINDAEAKKIVELFKKLGKLCDANVLEF